MSDEVRDLEHQYWTAIKDKDAKKAGAMSDDPCVVVGAQGAGQMDRKTLEGLFAGAQFELDAFSLDNVIVRAITDDVVVVAYKVQEKLRVDGENITLNANDASVWVKRDGRWVCALHTESIAGDPYGRR